MASSLKSAVIGTGLISKEHLSFLSQSAQAHLSAVCDLSPAAAKYAAQKFHADRYFTDYRQMLDQVKPDVVHILTPPHTHKAIATDCLAAGSHVICEKPITPTYDEFKDLWLVAQSNNRHLIENHNFRFNQAILRVEQMVQAGVLGEVQEVEIRMALAYRNGGRFADENLPSPIHSLPAGVIHDVITHICYLVLRFIPEFDRVNAAWNNHGGGELFKYDDLDAILISGSKHARIRFSTTTLPECFTLTVRGSKGYIETDLYQPYFRCVIPRPGGKQLSPLVNHFVNGWELMGASFNNFRNKIMQRTPYEGLYRLLSETYDALIHDRPMPVSFDDMERTNRLIATLLVEENKL